MDQSEPQHHTTFVGIDVAKGRLEVHLRPQGEGVSTGRAAAGLERLLAELRRRRPSLIVLEATGGYETVVASTLAAAGLPLAVVDPRQIRARSAPSPAPPAGWPRPMRWMPGPIAACRDGFPPR
jgi:transposase